MALPVLVGMAINIAGLMVAFHSELLGSSVPDAVSRHSSDSEMDQMNPSTRAEGRGGSVGNRLGSRSERESVVFANRYRATASSDASDGGHGPVDDEPQSESVTTVQIVLICTVLLSLTTLFVMATRWNLDIGGVGRRRDCHSAAPPSPY